jgi:asparagine synthase (glutamine-hydrolysing)
MRNMSASLVHRGPDSEGYYESGSISLGMRRLSIIDVVGGKQPVVDESGAVVAVFNGEIYNFGQLRSELLARGHTLTSNSDSECIPHLYEEYGVDFIDHLRGMFAIALWDGRRNRLILVRDRLGKKPLYYRLDPQGLAFASELKALLSDPRTDRSVDEIAVSHYLTYQFVPAPRTGVRSVRKLEPAQFLVYEGGQVRTYRYWQVEYAAARHSAEKVDEHVLAEQLRDLLVDCVKVRLVGERPLGAFLSGGLDSSAIVAAMSQVAGGRVKTFSIGFEQESYNELPFARRVAELYGTDHHEMVVRSNVAELLPRLARTFGEPYADSSAIPSYRLAEMTREHVVVALNGDGGDEAFGGYLRYPRFLVSNRCLHPRFLAGLVGAGGRTLRPLGGRSPLLRRVANAAILMADAEPARRYARFLSYFRPEEKELLLSSDFASRVDSEVSEGLVEAVWEAHKGTDMVNRLLAVDTATYLPGDLLPKVDLTTMAFSLEARSPFLDHTLVEWAAALPGHLKVRGPMTKHLLRKALEPWLPPEVIGREKMGFGVPLGQWLRGSLREMLYDLLTDRRARGRGWFKADAVDRLLADHMAGQDRSPHLYALLMLEMWNREVLESMPEPA